MREDSIRPSCQECQTNQATHFCEDCGSVMCVSCIESKEKEYPLCRECHTSLEMEAGDEEIEACPECESTNIGKGRRTEEICPQCHSVRIQNIEEKRRKLAQQLRASIKQLHYGHTKIREFNSALTSAKRLLYSLRMASFLHYRWLEDNIESLQEETVALRNRIMNQAEIVAKRIAAETKGVMDYGKWTTSQFPFIEGISNRVAQIGGQYKRDVDDALKTARVALDDIIKQLEGLDYYRKRFQGFYEVTELAPKELPVCALPEIRIAGSDFLRNDKATGTLYITNRRIVFIAETGLVRKKMDIIFDFPLMYLTSVEEDGRIRKRLVLRMKQGEIKLACNEQTQKVLPDYLEIARKFERYQQTDLQRVRKIEQHDTHVSDVRIKIETLVHSLLSIDGHARSSSREDDFAEYGRTPSYRRPYPIRETGYYRKEPRISEWDRRDFALDERTSGVHEVYMLRKEAMELERAIEDTRKLFRAGQLVPEEFIRRYRVLMRNAYMTHQEIKRLESLDRDWRY